ncbi:uncharacterized protein LOC128227508 [Mya arenaria]|uniref:uncharacterized protein LOC128227508 n=1 Tax=Mya arenaria TaxID=6604 RepID=UPI0022E5ED4A|nr:uncharacterized protein LOC128227508 [Mya arenaria]
MAYFEKCLEVSWLAAVQDPPLALNFNPGEKFDTALFKDYTKRGPYVEFLVWPALHLHEAGPLLTKGVAQGCQHNPYDRRRVIPSDQSFTPQNKQPRFNEEIRDADRQIYSQPVSSTKQNPNHSATFYQGTTRSGDRYNTGEHHKTMQPGRLGHQGYRDTQI